MIDAPSSGNKDDSNVMRHKHLSFLPMTSFTLALEQNFPRNGGKLPLRYKAQTRIRSILDMGTAWIQVVMRQFSKETWVQLEYRYSNIQAHLHVIRALSLGICTCTY